MKFWYIVLVATLLLTACGEREFKRSITVDATMDAFLAAGLECETPAAVAKVSESPLPKTFADAKRCVAPSVGDDHGVRVFTFDTERDLSMVKDYYEGFTGMFGSYVYRRENVVVQTSNSMPKEVAEKYKQALESVELK